MKILFDFELITSPKKVKYVLNVSLSDSDIYNLGHKLILIP